MSRQSLPADVQEKADVIMVGFLQEHEALCSDAVKLMLRGRYSFSKLIHSKMSPDRLGSSREQELYRELLRNSGRRASVARGASAELEQLLTDRQRQQMRSDIAAAAYGRRR